VGLVRPLRVYPPLEGLYAPSVITRFQKKHYPWSDLTNNNTPTPDLIKSDKEHLCRILNNSKYFLTIFDPGAISLPGVLNDYKRVLKLKFGGLLSHFILIHRNKAGH
jgi:hypothetical protein